jgi:peptide/nickel transport system substrate-binding protein
MSKSSHQSKKTRTANPPTRKGFTRRAVLKGAGAASIAAGLGTFSSNLFSVHAQGKRDMVWGLYGEPAGLNEFLRTGNQGGQVSTNVNEKLTRVDYAKRGVEPELALEWKRENDLTWAIKLREGVKWHKGYGELTAEDVAYTFNYIQDNKTFQISTAHFPVERTRARSKYVAEVKLKQPFAPFPTITMEYGGHIMCKAAHEEKGPEKYARDPVGTGPYVVEEWTSGSHMRLKRNRDYWKVGYPKLEEILVRIIPEARVRLNSLERGEIDFMDHPDPIDVAPFREGKKKDFAYQTVPLWEWDYMAFTFPPYQKPDHPTQIKEVRQAISYALDRQVIVDEIYAGEALVSDSPVPPGFLSYRDVPLRYPKTANLQKARELMKKAGVSGFDLEVITSDKEWLRRETELAAAMLSEIGINVKVQGLDLGTWTERWIRKHDFQALLEDISIVSPDVDSTVFWFHREGTVGYHGYPNKQVTEWLDQGRVEFDTNKRIGLYHKVVDQVLEDCPYIYLCHVNNVFLSKKGLQGFTPGPQEYVVKVWPVHWA